VPLYDANCPTCGVNEILAVPSEVHDGLVQCGLCRAWVPQLIGPSHGQYVRIDAGGEPIETSQRRRDGTAEYNLGLYGVDTVVGTRPDGKPKLAYRPITHHELKNNRGVREAAKRQGLTPVEHGRYRTIGR